jgi:hypothetical protein
MGRDGGSGFFNTEDTETHGAHGEDGIESLKKISVFSVYLRVPRVQSQPPLNASRSASRQAKGANPQARRN